ncbi:DUF2946 family protein [Niveibacterium sp.]|uniref:DUF2946 family protein n=1 Tax=Niveibacterium sp. TaxID=2017444 RepID=UPI0035AE245B
MGMRGQCWRFAWWGAFVAIMVAACMPTLSRTLSSLNAPFSSAGGSSFAEICTARGLMFRADPGEPDRPDLQGRVPAQLSLDHCPFCVLQFAAPLPEAASMPGLISAKAIFVPRLFLSAPRPLFIWASAAPRAPPLHV